MSKATYTNTEDVPDAMPAEVALAYLTNPKAKITNAFRKVCNAARATITPSNQPLIRNGDNFLEPKDNIPIEPATKIAKRLQSVPVDRLQRIVTRCLRRQRMTLNAANHAKTDFVRNQLAEVWNRLQLVLECAVTEIKNRTKSNPAVFYKPGNTRRHPLWRKIVEEG